MAEHWLIIGGSGGIAQGIIRQLLAEQQQVSVLSRQAATMSAGTLQWFQVTGEEDPALPEILTSIFSRGVTAVMLCQGWLHGSGVLPEKTLRQLQRPALQQSLEINLMSPAFYLQILLPYLQRAPGIKVAVLSAKVGSITDNQLGGWYSYRMAKAALNMLVKCTSIELGRFNKTATLFTLHPGTTDTALSAPFQQNLPAGQLQSGTATANRLLKVIRQATTAENGLLLNWDGQVLAF